MTSPTVSTQTSNPLLELFSGSSNASSTSSNSDAINSFSSFFEQTFSQESSKQLSSNNSLDDTISALQSTLLSGLQNSLLSSAMSSTTNNQTTTNEVKNTDTSQKLSLFSSDEISFKDGFDTLNLLNHIPIVSSLYQQHSDQGAIGAISQLAGGFLFYGSTGLIVSAADLVYEGITGKSFGDTVVDFNYAGIFSSDEEQAATPTEVNKGNYIYKYRSTGDS